MDITLALSNVVDALRGSFGNDLTQDIIFNALMASNPESGLVIDVDDLIDRINKENA